MKRVDFALFLALSTTLFIACDITGTKASKRQISYLSSKVEKGAVVQTVSATGTIEPVELIDIGAQVSGKILAFGKGQDGEDLDYCSIVTNGMLLAKIDDVTYVADLNVARAQLQRSEASVAVARAQLLQSETTRNQTRREWERAQKIGVGPALSQTTYEKYRTDYENSEATVAVASAQLKQAEASVIEAKASVEKAERNLSYCEIVSSVDGIIIDRRVNVGQTVVSSMSASSLFLVARDLSQVQIWVAVNEADIGTIKPGGRVTFTVDTFPGRTFTGTVKRIRLNATISSNVVTYTVEVDTDNSDYSLLPYLTANVRFETARSDGGLVIPAKALRFAPAGEKNLGNAVYTINRTTGEIKRINVKVLLSNGINASVESNELKENMEVITSISTHSANQKGNGSGEKNPFMPDMPKPQKRPPRP